MTLQVVFCTFDRIVSLTLFNCCLKMNTLMIWDFCSATEHLCHGPPKCKQGLGETPPSITTLPHPIHEYRCGPGWTRQSVPTSGPEEEQTEGVHMWVWWTLKERYPPPEDEESGTHWGRLEWHQRRREARVRKHHRGDVWRQFLWFVKLIT